MECPLFGEQEMDAVMLSEDLKITLRVEENEKDLVGREEIAKCASDLIVGEGKLRQKRVRDPKDAWIIYQVAMVKFGKT